MKTIADIAYNFSEPKEKNDSQWTATCPVCNRKGHLYISKGNGNKALLYCQGCHTDINNILAAIGKEAKDILYLDEPTKQTKPTKQASPVAQSQDTTTASVQTKTNHGAVIEERKHQYTEHGEVVGIKHIKKYADGHKDAYWSLPDGTAKQPKPCPLYNIDSTTGKESVCIVEGEKDVETMIRLGSSSTVSFPNGAGQSTWDDTWTDALKGKKIYVITDNDDAGRNHGKWIWEKLQNVAKTIYVLSAKDIYPDIKKKGDISDIAQEVGDGEAKKLLSNAIKQQRENSLVKLGIYKASDLEHMDLQPPPFIVRELLPVGLTIFAAPPKTGKSFACMDLCASVATGENFWGRHTEKGAVLYCDLEDSQWRVKERYKKMGIPLPDNMYVIHNMPRIDNGLYLFLSTWIENVENPRLIVIDTLANIKPEKGSRRDAYTQDTQDLHPLQQFALDHKIAILLITHLRKNGSSNPNEDLDPYERITGSNGQFGVADASWMILGKRKESAQQPTEFGFRAAGRDFRDVSLQISWLPDTLRWKLLGDTATLIEQREIEAFANSPVVQTIIYHVEFSAAKTWSVTASEMLKQVYEYTHKTDANTASDKSLGKFIASIEDRLLSDYKIQHEKSVRYNGKAGGKLHTFRKISETGTAEQETV